LKLIKSCMKYLLSVVLFSLLICGGLGITKEMRRFELFCTFKDLYAGDWLLGSYIVSGYNEQNMALQIFSPNNEVIHVIEREKEGNFQLNITETGEYRACFRNLEKDLSYVSFEWFAPLADGKSGGVNTNELTDLGKNLEKTVKSVKDVRRNLNYQKIRENVHATNLEELESRISWSSFFKVLSIAGFAGGQFFILTGLLNKKINRVSV